MGLFYILTRHPENNTCAPVLKDEIRQQLLKQRLDLSAKDVERHSHVIQDRLMKSAMWPKSGHVGLYSPVKNEVLTHDLFQKGLEGGLHVYFPRVEQGIQFYEVNGPDDLQKGSWAIPEPKKNCNLLENDVSLDLLVVPGIGFDHDGYRVGYGKGFYDDFIAGISKKMPVIGLAYDFQMIKTFAIDEWDQQLSGVMTEKSFYSAE